MKYIAFEHFAKATKIDKKQYFLLWRTWRFEKADYMQDVLNEYLAINPRCKTVRDMFRSSNNIGIILKKHRRLRRVTVEGLKENLYNMPRILSNCDINHGERPGVIYFPLVYTHCPECNLTVKKMSSEGVWMCICKYYWIDAFYNVDKIKEIWGIKDQTTPEENISIVEKSQELPF
jgi:hypothetical protein